MAEGRTPNALESDDSPISQDSQKDGKFIDRATSPLKPMQSEFEVKRGTPTPVELQTLGLKIAEKWKQLGRRLDVRDERLSEIDHAHAQLSEKGYAMLEVWRQSKGSAATYQALCDALQDETVLRRDLAETFCYIKGKEVVEAGRNQVTFARVPQTFSEMMAGSKQGPENLNEKVESPSESLRKKISKTATRTRAQEIPETTVKQLNDRKESIENSMEDVEVVEKELGKQLHLFITLERTGKKTKTAARFLSYII